MTFRLTTCIIFTLLYITPPASAQTLEFQKVFGQHGVVMLLIDPNTGVIIDANPAAAQFYGHERDKLVQSLIRRTDTLGRWGGEEYILVCPETSLPTARIIAEKICTTVREYQFARGLGITLSIGVSEIQSGATLKEILVEVDRKMYLAKQKGRDRVES